MQKEEDLRGDDLKHYEAEFEAMNLILISIPNDIYNSVDACKTAKAMWQRVERLMRRTVQNKVDRETRFNNEFDQFVAEPGEALVSVYNRFAQLMNDLERNGIIFPNVTVNTKFLNCLQPEWLKYVTQICLAKRLTDDTYDDLFDYLYQFKKLYDEDYQRDAPQNTSEDPLTSAMILLAQAITQRFSNPINNRLRTSSNTRNQAIVQADRVQIQSRNSGDDGRNTRRLYVEEEFIEGTNVQNDAGNIQRNLRTTSLRTAANDEEGVILTNKQNDFLFADASRMEEIKELNTQEQKYPKQPKIINNTIGDDQIDSNIIFDEPNRDVNSGSVEYNNNVQESYALEQLARNAFKEAKKQQIIAKKAGQKAKRFERESQSQFIHDRDVIRDLEQQRDKLELSVVELKRQNMELQKTQSILKHKMSENEDKYHDTILDLEARAKKNEDVVLKMGNSLQNPRLYDASCLDDSKIQMNVRDTEDILDNATKSQIKIKKKSQDRIAIEKKQNVWTIDYKKLNALYEDFVPQKEFSAEQKYFSSSFISSKNSSKASSSSSSSETKPTVTPMPTANPMLVDLNKMENDFKTLFALLQTNSKRERISYTSPEEIRLTNFMRVASSVRRPSNRDSSFKNSVLSNTKNSSEKVEVSHRSNKKSDVASKNVDSNKKIVTNYDIKNALIANNVLCVSCAKNMLIPCHDNYLAKYKLNVHSKVRRALFTTSRTVKSKFEVTTPVVSKTRFSVKIVQSKSLDTTHVVSKTKIATVTPLSAKNKVVQIVMWIVDSGCSKYLTGDRSLLKNFVGKFIGTVCFGNDHFAAITGYGDYVQGNINVCHVYYIEGP
ncbi:integrase, catalytic region, zinc finger, CCHC-type containing protein [Tanacetum coccineum]